MSIHRTLVFQVHNPSKRTAAVLHRSLRSYTCAARAVLSAAERDWDELRSTSLYGGRLSAMNLAATMMERYRARTTPFPLHSSLRAALFADLAAALCSYDALATAWDQERASVLQRVADANLDPLTTPPLPDNLARQVRRVGIDPSVLPLSRALAERFRALGVRPSFPTAPRTRPDYAAWDAELDRLATEIDGPPRPARLAEHLRLGTRPLYFPRPDGASMGRNFSLLRSEKDGRYYALIYLLPRGDPHARRLAVPPPDGKRGSLVALHADRTALQRKASPSSAVLLPLACGEWHERTALREALARPESVRVARLYHRAARRTATGYRPERFMIAITFEQQTPDARVPHLLLGVSVDDQSRVAWAVRDPDGGSLVAAGTNDRLRNLQMSWRDERRKQGRLGRIPGRAHHIQAEQVKHLLHSIANDLVRVADQYQAQLALADVRYLRDLTHGYALGDAGAERHYRNSSLAIGALERILGHKLLQAGLPRPLTIGGISPRDCAACMRRSQSRERCTSCGQALGLENTAQLVAARIPEVTARIAQVRAQRAQQATGDATY